MAEMTFFVPLRERQDIVPPMLFDNHDADTAKAIGRIEHLLSHINERITHMAIDVSRLVSLESDQNVLIAAVVARLTGLEQAIRDVAATLASEVAAQDAINALADKVAADNAAIQAALDANPLPAPVV
jgi:hypothetical protein